MVSGLRERVRAHLTTIISTADNGGSSGVLSESYGLGPVGDLRRVCGALANDSKLKELAEFRHERGCLAPHTFGNLMLATLFEECNSIEEAIDGYCKLIGAQGTVIPVTLGKQTLYAKLENGEIIEGETHIDIPKHDGTLKITNAWLMPRAFANPRAEAAILAADVVIIGPGDHFTSIIPNLLVDGIPKAIRVTKAMKVYIPNLMTKPGETYGYQMHNLLTDINNFLGNDVIDLIIANNEKFPEEVLASYASEGKVPIFPTKEGLRGVDIPVYLSALLNHGEFWHHDPKKIAEAIATNCGFV